MASHALRSSRDERRTHHQAQGVSQYLCRCSVSHCTLLCEMQRTDEQRIYPQTEEASARSRSGQLRLLPNRALLSALKGDFRLAEGAIPADLRQNTHFAR